jgi:hypothetical protein
VVGNKHNFPRKYIDKIQLILAEPQSSAQNQFTKTSSLSIYQQ